MSLLQQYLLFAAVLEVESSAAIFQNCRQLLVLGAAMRILLQLGSACQQCPSC